MANRRKLGNKVNTIACYIFIFMNNVWLKELLLMFNAIAALLPSKLTLAYNLIENDNFVQYCLSHHIKYRYNNL